MTKPELIKRIEAMIDDMASAERWGKVEVIFSRGIPHTLRKEITESISEQRNTAHAHKPQR